jgi:molecular chaperone HtpG
MTTQEAPATSPQRMEFKTELKQLLDLIIHSLYTKKEIFLRELLSNAADAIDKVRFESLTNANVLEGNSDWKIKLIADESAGTLTVSDNGIGMSRESIVENLGTIARSGTRAFVESLKQANAQNRPELIGQFGVGFYASFMVAERVTVLSRMAGEKSDGVKWESDGQGEFTVEPYEKPTRGTDVILHLREDAREFLKPWRLREIVKQYSDFIDHPIVMDVEHEDKDGKKTTEEDTFNSRKAIWLRPKNEIKQEEYDEFYKQLARDFESPLKTIHIAAEGTMEFRALMFLPAHRPMEWMMGPPPKSGLDLYVKRVLIQHQCEELVPPYLRFVRGVVDSSDLPLNVSRETLQHNPLLAKIKSNVINRILKTLDEMKTGERETYEKFYNQFGEVLKEGVGIDFANRERIADLLLLESTKTEAGKFTTLEQYLAGMTADQNEIYYLIGESRGLIENSPLVEGFKSRGQEVLLLTDPVDEYLVAHLTEYKGKRLKAVDKGDVEPPPNDEQKQKAEQFKPLLESLKQKLSDVKDVRLTSRLKESAACLVADQYGPTAHLERLMHRLGQGDGGAGGGDAFKRILELNADHPAVQKLRQLHEANASDPRIESYARLLLDQATIAEGSTIKDPASFAKRVNELIAGG